jgi:murein DD-endopeptidase MepM/ murein hydrolase activator NlpD
MTAVPTDRSATAPAERPQDDVALRLQRAAATLAARHGSDLNQTIPAVEYDKATGRRFFDTAPIPLRRLLGSPLARSGKFAQGPARERRLSGGWGDPRSFSYDPRVNTNARHQGLDFVAPAGEPVLSCGDGIVSFAGYQSRDRSRQAIGVDGAHADARNNVLDKAGNVVALQAQVGFGGIAVHVKHNGDFDGYRTEYYHLASVTVREGQRVAEGQQIGTIGNTGVAGIGPHLHFQVALVVAGLSALVRPTALVPNYWPGHADSTTTAVPGQVAPASPTIGLAPAGSQVATSAATAQTQAADRATITQNQGVSEVKRNQARHSDLMETRLGAYQGGLYATMASFQGGGAIVTSPMTFNFTTGTWSDGQPI